MRAARLALAAALVAAASAAVPTRAHAQSACVAGTLADYIALGTTGCTVGDVLFSDFLQGAASQAGLVTSLAPVTAATPAGTGAGFDVTFSPAAFAGGPLNLSADWEEVLFQATAPLGSRLALLSVRNVTGTIVPGSAPPDCIGYVVQFASTGGPVDVWARETNFEPCTVIDESIPDAAVPGVYTSLGVNAFAGLDGGTIDPSASVSVTGFRVLVTPEAVTAPEPASLALTAAGVVGLAAVTRRRRRSA